MFVHFKQGKTGVQYQYRIYAIPPFPGDWTMEPGRLLQIKVEIQTAGMSRLSDTLIYLVYILLLFPVLGSDVTSVCRRLSGK